MTNNAETTVLLQTGDTLNDIQTLRLLEAIAVLKAKRDALASGVPVEQLDLYTWVVDVDPSYAEAD